MGFKIFIMSSHNIEHAKFLKSLFRKTSYMRKNLKCLLTESCLGGNVTTIYLGNRRLNLKYIQYDGGIVLLDKDDDEIKLKIAKDIPLIHIVNYRLGDEVKILQSLLFKIMTMD